MNLPSIASAVAAGVRRANAPRPRWYQSEMRDNVLASWALGLQNVLAVLPTGGGKTVLFAMIVADHVGASCCIAHRQELVGQISMALARNGVRHRIIAPAGVVRAICQEHLAELGVCYYDPNASAAVAGVDTLLRRDDPWFKQVTLWVQDECFPAGTLIDGRPIEQIRVGDVVTAFNEQTGELEQRRVVRLFKNLAPKHMVRVSSTHHVLDCTPGHPFFTRRGWVPAVQLTAADEVLIHAPGNAPMHDVREFDDSRGVDFETVGNRGPGLLQSGMLEGVSGASIVRDNGTNESSACVGPYEVEQPNGPARKPQKDAPDLEADGARAEIAGRERTAANRRRNDPSLTAGRLRVRVADASADGGVSGRGRAAVGIQGGLRARGVTDSDRSGRGEPLVPGAPSARPQERGVLSWARVDSAQIYERGDPRFPRHCADDGFVYNFEVEGLHTYVADGVVVHNCHHVLKENKWGKAAALFPNAKGLGVTATPCRADGKGLGRHADGLFDVMHVGPTMRELINLGYLTDYRIVCAPTHIETAKARVGANGDYVLDRGTGKAAVRDSTLVGDVVKEYQRWTPGRLGVVFTSDLDTAADIAEQFRRAGVPAEMVDGTTPDATRRDVLRRFRARELLVLVNVDLFGEGFDLPAIEVVQLARPTMSFALHAQQFGRALRLLVDKAYMASWDDYPPEQRLAIIAASSKPRATIIDHVGNCVAPGLGLPDSRNDWTLDAVDRKSKGADDAEPLAYCLNPICAQVYPRAKPVCPYCGVKPERAGGAARSIKTVDGDLLELDPATLAAMRGELAQALPTLETYRAKLSAQGLPHTHVLGNAKHHYAKLQAAENLRDAMAWWAGEKRAAGQCDQEIYRRFYLTFGLDWLGAQMLGRADMDALAARIDEKLTAPSLAARVRPT